ncbi:flagellar assembly lytic transglycosylase [Borrelia miyamotoi]|uniref:Lytic transglycosylase domain-containing protein n=1 Tax=Borrelia miyamotoi TaxID=47466 RepID=A0AAQ2WYF7_9SPIR|nr:lytic transglycosylase domain-containing protein [Borrelia miyamotoi]AOW96041.1 transglycosylase [Borrelia miyamotoi]QTL83401.1 lytic transglycosylase domain-containing protein [Borrelia miyamotoi]WAZ85302.1 lytic transglycosylase domain-containing protein [Borrelia miyamotoi]WAZ91085.1 lytic transglycosylase domain-containing protein [Borrelia miyamotoi]WAZ92371.1 lytic transglycosylase domain-containing protein [Borrelia miyamotoi]
MKKIIMFRQLVCFFLLSLLSCSFGKVSSLNNVVKRNVDDFDLNHLSWLWNFDYLRQNFDEYFGIDSNSYVYVAYLFKKIGYDEKFKEYMYKAIKSGNDIMSQFAGVKLLEYYNARREYYDAELIGRKLYKKYDSNKFIILGYFKSLYWQKKNDEALLVLNKLEKMDFFQSQDNENILFKAVLYFNASDVNSSLVYFKKLFEDLPAGYLHIRAHDYLNLENRPGLLSSSFLNLVKFKALVANGDLKGAVSILSDDFKGYYNNFAFLNDVYKSFLGSGDISKALLFFSDLNSIYKDYYLGLINLRLKRDIGLFTIIKYLENTSFKDEPYRLEMLNEIFSNLIFTQDARNYFVQNIARFYTDKDKNSLSFIKVLDEYILEAVQLEDYGNLYALYRNGQDIIDKAILSRLAFINARLIYHKFINSKSKNEYNELLRSSIEYNRTSYASFMSQYLLGQSINNFFEDDLDIHYDQSDYERFLEGFLKFNLHSYVSAFVANDFKNGYRFSPNFYRKLYDELIKHEYYYESTIAINYLVRQDSSALNKDDYMRLYPCLYSTLVNYWAKRRGLYPSLVFALIKAESSFKRDAISKPGAIGLMQIMPLTSADVSKEIRYYDYDLKLPKDNIIIGTYYLSKRIGMIGDVYKALASYNGGIGNVRKWEKDYGHLPKELFIEAIPFGQTRNYIKKILVYSVLYDALYYSKGMGFIIEYIMGKLPKSF